MARRAVDDVGDYLEKAILEHARYAPGAPVLINGEVMKIRGLDIFLLIFFGSGQVLAQQSIDIGPNESIAFAEGWRGFTELGFLVNAFFILSLSAVLGAVIGYHPYKMKTADTLLDVETPKVYILSAVIGAIIGILVLKYGLVVGFVVFGIGGLIRFRTVMASANLTVHVIFVTLIGLSSGLNLPHIAVLSTLFGFVLISIVDRHAIFQIEVKGIGRQSIVDAAAAYRGLLEQRGCRIISEKKNPAKESLVLIFRCSRKVSTVELEQAMNSQISGPLKGIVDWEVD